MDEINLKKKDIDVGVFNLSQAVTECNGSFKFTHKISNFLGELLLFPVKREGI